MGKKIELTKMSCPSCGAELNDFAGKDQISCEYCNAKCKVINPSTVDLEKYKTGFTADNYDKFKNVTAIIESSMQAENYIEAYNYCNKALELNPKVGEIWENKAICSFWKSISLFNEDKIVYSNAKEIVTFLNASKERDPDSESYDVSADGIGFNLGHICLIKAALVRPDVEDAQKKMTGFSVRNLNRIKDYMDTAETAFDIMVNKETEFLKICVNEYSNQSKAVWIKKQKDQLVNATTLTFDPVKKREVLINKIKKYEPNYTPPEVKSSSCFIATATMGSYEHPQVMELRHFRDDWILEKSWGESFVKWYYHYGEKAARVIDKSFVLRKFSYLLIVKPLVYLSRIVKK